MLQMQLISYFFVSALGRFDASADNPTGAQVQVFEKECLRYAFRTTTTPMVVQGHSKEIIQLFLS